MENVFGGDGLLANPALGEGKVFRNSWIKMMRDHHHIESFIQRIHRVRPSWSRGGWNDVGFAADFNDIRGMSAARSFRVKRVNGSALEGRDCVLDETAFVERVGMNKDLHVHVVCD